MESKGSTREEKKTGDIEELWKLVDGIETAMLTTRRSDGHLVSRPMATQVRSDGADFWFVTADGTPRLRDISEDPRVNLAYYRDRTREWISVSGEAEISRNRSKIEELWRPDWKAWFVDEGGKKDGGPKDPRLVLIGVHARSAEYMTVDKPQPLVLLEMFKGLVTGKTAQIGEVKRVPLKRGVARAGGRPPRAVPRRNGVRGGSSRHRRSH